MSILKEILEVYPYLHLIKLDDLDDAVIGIDLNNEKLVYSYKLIIDTLKKNNPDWTNEDVLDWYHYNIVGTIMNKNMPLIVEIWK